MGRTIKSKVKISEVFFDEELYPRAQYDWHTGYVYSQSMQAGAVFPPIVLALNNGKKYLVDGKHRLEAYKTNKINEVEAIIHTGWDKKRIYLEAVKANIAHGRGLSPYEKRKIALKLIEMKLSQSDISHLIQVPQDKLDNFIAQRLINTITGEEITGENTEKISKEIGQAILKSGIKHFAGQTFEPQEFQLVSRIQEPFSAGSQEKLLEELMDMLKNNLLDRKNPRIKQLLQEIKKLI